MIKKFKRSMTAEQALAALRSDPEWVAARAKEDEQRQKRKDELRRAEAPLVNDLRAAGFDVDTVWDLVNTSTPYPDALPILADHLGREYPAKLREGIARSLAVRDAKFAWDDLVVLFKTEKEEIVKDGVAVAIAAIADDSVVDEVIRLAQDKQYGPSRLLLLRALARSRKPEAHEALSKLGADPELKVEVRSLLRRKKQLE